MEYNSGHEVGVGLADAGPGVAEGNAAALHGLQHPVAQGDLLRALRHPLEGEQVLENMVDVPVGILPVLINHP